MAEKSLTMRADIAQSSVQTVPKLAASGIGITAATCGSRHHISGFIFAVLVSMLCLWNVPASAQVQTGTYVGDGIVGRTITGLFFQPAAVIVKARHPKQAVCKTATMPINRTKMLEAASAFMANQIISLDTDGFTLGNDDEVNKSGVIYDWIAIKAIDGRVATGSYVGDGSDNRIIDISSTSPSQDFQPDYVILMQDRISQAVHRSSVIVGDSTMFFSSNNPKSNAIQDLSRANGFEVGNDDLANGNGTDYHYIAFKSIAGRMEVGSYTGDGSDNRDLHPLGFVPEYVIIKDRTNKDGVHRTARIVGDETMYFKAADRISNVIQALLADGFQVGTNDDVNRAGFTYYWQAFHELSFTDLSISNSVDNVQPGEGDTLTYTIRVNNNGPVDDEKILVTDQLPPQVTYLSDSPSVGSYDIVSGLWNVGSLSAGSSETLILTATVNAGTGGLTAVNTATITTSYGLDSLTTNNTDTAISTIAGSDLSLTKTVDVPAPGEGDTIVYTVTLINNGPNDNTGIQVTDLLPAGVTYVSALPSQGTYNSVSGLWNIGAVTSGVSVTLELTATVDVGTGGTGISNTAIISAAVVADGNTSNNSDTANIEVGATDLALTKTVNILQPSEGDTLIYTLTLTNTGPNDATGVEVTDTLAPGLTYASDTPSQGTYNSGAGTWDVGSVINGAQATLTLRATIDAGTRGNTITNTATISGADQANLNAANDEDSVDVVVQSADLSLSKLVNNATPDENELITYSLVVTNSGPSSASGIQVTDALPAGVTYVGATPGQGSYDNGTGIWNVGSLTAGSSAALVLSVRVDPGTAGTSIPNTASITDANQVDPDTSNNTATADLTVTSVDLAITKSVDDAAPNEGETITYTVAVANGGPNNATNVKVTEVLPTGVTYVSSTPSQGSYNSGTGMWTVGTVINGANATLTLTATVDAGTNGSTISNTATYAGSDQADPNSANDSDSADIIVQSSDLELVKNVDVASPNEGDTIDYTITVSNNGPQDATGITVSDALPAGVTYVSDTPSQGTYDNGTGVWNVGNVSNGASATLTVTVSVDAGTNGDTITNGASVTAVDQGDPVTGNNSDNATITVQSSDLVVSKNVDKPTPTEGEAITYTIALSNDGPDDATNIEVTDLLPSGVTYVSGTPSQGTYDNSTGVWNVGNVNNGAGATLTLTATVDPGTGGSLITNTASVTRVDQADPNLANNSNSAEIGSQSADLVVTKSVDLAAPNEGVTITYTITLDNNGPSNATGIEITDALPAGVTYISDTPSQGTYDNATGVWTVGTVNNGTSATLALTARVDAGTNGSTIINSANVTAIDQADPDGGNNVDTANITVQGADLSVTKSVDDPTPNEGGSISYTITLDNTGPDAGSNIQVTDVLPAGLIYVSSTTSQGSYDSGTGVWNVGTVNNGASATLTLTATVDAGTNGSTINNAADITALDQADPNAANDSDNVDITVQSADLQITKSVDDSSPNEGQTVSYVVTLTNAGPDDATGVEVIDTLPAGLTYVSDAPSQGAYDSGTGVWTVGTVNNGASATLSLTATVDAGTNGATITNTASVSGVDQGDPNTGNSSDSVNITVQESDLSLTKLVNNPTPNEGSVVSYSIVVTNSGPSDATSLAVTDVLPAGVSHASHTPSAGTYNSATGVWTIGTLANGASATLILNASVDAGSAGDVITNTASVTALDQADPNSGNNIATADITVTSVDLAVTKSVDDATPNEGQTIVYTINIANGGPDDASGIKVTDALPAGLTYVSDTASQGSYKRSTGVWTVGSINNGGNATLALTVTVDAGTNGNTIANSASVTSSEQADPNPANDSDSAGIVVQSSDLEVVKNVDFASPNEGDTITYTITVTNNGPDTATGVALIDSLPTGVTYVVDGPSQGTYDSGTGLWTVGTIGSTASATLSLTASVGAGTRGSTITNSATISNVDQGDPDPLNNLGSVDITVQSADLQVTKNVDKPTPSEGETITYTITLANNGPDTGSGIELTDVLPAGVTYVSDTPSQGSYDSGAGVWTVGTVSSGASVTMSLVATVDAGSGGSLIRNTAGVTAVDQADPNPSNNSSSAEIGAQSADLQVSKSVDQSAPNEADTVTYTVTISNSGPSDATGIALTDSIPAGVTYVSNVQSQGSYDSGTGLWTVGNIASGANATLTLRASVDAGTNGSTITNSAMITTADQADPDGANNIDTAALTVQSADLEVVKSVDAGTPNEGQSIQYTISLTNNGPNSATNVAIIDVLPVGVTYGSYAASQGTYDETSGLWSVGTLANGLSASLTLTVNVDAGTQASTISNSARVDSADQADPAGANNSDSVDITVQSADLAILKSVDEAAPNEGDTVTYTVILTNDGPDPGTGIVVTDLLPAGVTYVSSTQSRGSYDSGTGVWTLGSLANGFSDTLSVVATVDTGTGGSVITNTAGITAVDQADPDPANNSSAAVIGAQSADLQLTKAVDDASPNEGETVTYTLTLSNGGPNNATGVEVTEMLPAGLTYSSAVPSQGSYNNATGVWSVGALAHGSSAALLMRASVDVGAGGSLITNIAAVTRSDQVDPISSNDSSSVDVAVQLPAIRIAVDPPANHPLRPGEPGEEVYRIRLINSTAVAETLVSLSLSNTTAGPGTTAHLDASWSPLELYSDVGGTLEPPATSSGPSTTAGSFSGGQVTFSGLAVLVPPGETRELVVHGAASLTARDGDLLGISLAAPGDVVFSRVILVSGDWPLRPLASYRVDGMTAAQIEMTPIQPMNFLASSVNNLALDVVLPANGYEADHLDKLNVINLGSAVAVEDISEMKAWLDNGDDLFDPANDIPLGGFFFTGSRWELTAIGESVPVGGLRIYVTVDLAELASEGRTVRLALPSQPDVAVGMASGNDGPLDQSLANPFAQAASTINRITLTLGGQGETSVAPGTSGVPLLQLVATNSYSVPKRVTSLTLTNLTSGSDLATAQDLDGEIDLLLLRLDGNDDGFLGGIDDDPVVGVAGFSNGKARFTGLGWDLPAGRTRQLFVTGDVSLLKATDGDALQISLLQGADLVFEDETTLAASWPLDSNSRLTIDGMVSEQIRMNDITAATLAPDGGPYLAFDVTVPPNGYLDDTLNGVRLVNAGSATNSDLAELRLWQDGGDGLFSPGSGDDIDLGSFNWLGDSWNSTSLSQVIPRSGLRLFVGLTVGSTPTDSATVRLILPRDGLTVSSLNDGPRDANVESTQGLLLSSRPLLAGVEIASNASIVGQNVMVRMVVRNVGGEMISNISPTGLTNFGDGTFALLSGPTPAVMTLAVAETDTFTWIYRADAVGTIRLQGGASGAGDPSGLTRSSLQASSNTHRVLLPAGQLDLYTIGNMPFSINRGQADVTPLSLTFSNPGGSTTSSVQLNGFRARLEDETGSGIVPSDLLSKVTVSEGTNDYLVRTSLETSGSEIDLSLASPVIVTGLEPVTLSIKLDISGTTTVSEFRVVILNSSWFVAEDATSRAPVPVALLKDGYPIRSGLGRLVQESVRLDVSGSPATQMRVGRGQDDIPAVSLELTNPGLDGLSSDVKVEGLTLQIMDSTGAPVQVAADVFDRVSVEGPFQMHLDRALGAGDSPTLTLVLSPPVAVPVNRPIAMNIRLDVSPTATLGSYNVVVGDAADFLVRDANTGAPVPAIYAGNPLAGATVIVEAPATDLLASGRSEFPSTVTVGSPDVTALTATLSHPGSAGTARIRSDRLTVHLRDERRNPLVPRTFLDQVRVLWNGFEIGSLLELPEFGDNLTMSLSGIVLEPGETGELTVIVEIAADAPASFLELVISGSDLHAVDMNSGVPVSVTAEPSEALPLLSGVTRLVAPALELFVRLESQVPAVLAGRTENLTMAALTIENPAPENAGDIVLDRLDLVASDRNFNALSMGTVASEVNAFIDGTLWASSGSLGSSDVSASLVPETVSSIRPGKSLTLELQVSFRPSIAAESFRLGLEEAGVGVVQPASAALAVRVLAAEGGTFPLWTEEGNFTSTNLGASYANFPNPFAAGRQETKFVYFLPEDGTLHLKILTPRGETVRTLLDGAFRSAGLHQDDVWDGLNGRGKAVVNGVYLAELIYTSNSGNTQRLLRKIAVMR